MYRVKNPIISRQIFQELAPKVLYTKMARHHQSGEWMSHMEIFRTDFDHNSKAKRDTLADSYTMTFDQHAKLIDDRH